MTGRRSLTVWKFLAPRARMADARGAVKMTVVTLGGPLLKVPDCRLRPDGTFLDCDDGHSVKLIDDCHESSKALCDWEAARAHMPAAEAPLHHDFSTISLIFAGTLIALMVWWKIAAPR